MTYNRDVRYVSPWRWLAGTLLIIAILGSVLGSLTGHFLLQDSGATAAIEVFEAHSLALDEGRFDDAAVLLNCRQVSDDQLREAVTALEQFGGFAGTYPVLDEWVHSGSEHTILDLGSPEGFPSIQTMVKVDGERKLECSSE